MRARVVYESMYGNTAAVARAIADGLAEHASVEVLDVATADIAPLPPVDLVVVGGPTHAFGLSRPNTRADAATRTEKRVTVDIGIREWLDDLPPVPAGSRAAAFGTKVAKPPWLPGSSARGAAKRLRRLGYQLVGEPADFVVDGMMGPLIDGELVRARTWAEELAAAVAEQTVGHS
ncbi:flavodoxin domain-containing protein [Nocardia cyriacigeorgica]|uniref:flavodoxin family protein n=1 Tax=Nocardia cyriacigeorgica TaxID=135487 RepID=UPI00189599D6|nr:flavodoxin domain-containing protein [Nocardia cyriacigeorgica]MBF6090561.1 flavodoxin domain-containing protein [Nocardia cyriacigeorgica]MBF6095604.1 flavodoxin domain-containing protein [Nocardia cyriacigeorgica]MBF6096516.1 flavodoxin domain-containing protein [Nocardia cyriacigeorgica]MBF6317182.1 flavodoxin domain-containing protein [Nocardia cyriacigeorgica]MBF6323291.1 flavodoxin domain-containing protein [Nocardia cyriacigeorgica]